MPVLFCRYRNISSNRINPDNLAKDKMKRAPVSIRITFSFFPERKGKCVRCQDAEWEDPKNKIVFLFSEQNKLLSSPNSP